MFAIRWYVATMLGLLLIGAAAVARADVRDDANYFTKAAVEKAEKIVHEVKKETTKDVIIESFAEAPASRRADLVSKDDKTRGEARAGWAHERERERRVNGIYVLLCKDPHIIQVEVGPKTAEKAFTIANRNRLYEILRSKFTDKKFDDGLLEGVQYVLETMRANLKDVKGADVAHNYVQDKGKFFSEAAIRKAETIDAEIGRRWKNKEVIVETFEKKPADEPSPAEWARSRARARRVNGVYILVCGEPHLIEVEAGAESKEKAFTTADTKRLNELLKKDFSAKHYDEGLVAGLEFVRDTMSRNLASTATPGPKHAEAPLPGPVTPKHSGGTAVGFNWLGWLCPLLIVVGIIWLVIGIVRAFTSRSSGAGPGPGYGPGPGSPGYGPGPGYGGGYGGGGGGGGGGGFLSGLAGGLFGAVAGNWLYNSFLGGHSTTSNVGTGPTAYGSPAPPPAQTPDSDTLRSDDGRDFSGTGGSYGDDSATRQEAGGGGDTGGGGDYGDSGDTGGGGDYGDSGDTGGGGDYGGGGDSGGGGDFGGGGDNGGGGDY